MKVLIACKESQRVCCAFRELGHGAGKAQKPYLSRHSKSYGGAMGRESK